VSKPSGPDAAERALLRWPRDGIPRNPAAWLTTTARRRAVDVLRRSAAERRKHAELAALESLAAIPARSPDMSPFADDRLRLVLPAAIRHCGWRGAWH